MQNDTRALATQLGQLLLMRQGWLATAESCTGGLLSGAVTAIPGSSGWFDQGWVTYSNRAKHAQLGVARETLEEFGAVSEEVARAMALGAFYRTQARAAVSVTGIAGPDGGSDTKPVGTVCFAWLGQNQAPRSTTAHFNGSRQEIRQQSAKTLIEGLIALTLSLDL